MKILITGAGGWLGSELTEQILKQGNSVRALVLKSSNKLEKLKNDFGDKLEIVCGDICNKEHINKGLKDIEEVYHLAARVHSLPKSKEDEDEFFKINTYATGQLFNLCIKHKVKRVIFYSSVSVYGEHNKIIDVNTHKNPITPYGKSKLMAEEIGLKLYNEKRLPITIIEPVTVYGGDDVGNFEKLRALVNKGIAIRFGDGLNKKTIIYYKDLIQMTINIAKDKETMGKVIICGTESVSLNEILEVFINNLNRKIIIFRISNSVTKSIIKFCNLVTIRKIRNVGRNIKVLSTSNRYIFEESLKYLEKYKKFKDYYKNIDSEMRNCNEKNIICN